MSDAMRRAARTFVQAFVGVIVVQAAAIALQVQQGTWVPDLEWIKRLLASAVAAGVIALCSFIQNWLEDNTEMPAVGKAVASGGQNPVGVQPPG